jgi:hypothetical protein
MEERIEISVVYNVSVSAVVSDGPCGLAARVSAEMVVSTLCWIKVQGCERRSALMHCAATRKAVGERDDGRERRRRECTAEKTSIEAESSSGFSGSVYISYGQKAGRWDNYS